MRLRTILNTLLLSLLSASACAGTIGSAIECTPDMLPGVNQKGLICSDPELSRLDRQMAWTFRRAMSLTAHEGAMELRSHQLNWEVLRDRCWLDSARRTCMRNRYQQRIAELQARFGLLSTTIAQEWRCSDPEYSSIRLEFIPSTPATLILQHKDTRYLLFASDNGEQRQYSGEGSQYREDGQRILLSWPGLNEPAHCRNETTATR